MQISVFQIVQLVLIAIILFYLVYYVYTVLFDKKYQPKAWLAAAKKSKIAPDLSKLERKYPDKVRFFNLWFQVERLRQENIAGDFAELGVYKGDSAELIHMMDRSRTFHLFDTFSGFTKKDLKHEEGKAATYTTRNFADTSLEQVKARLRSPKFKFCPGYFPDSAKGLENLRFALVNMDADLFNPTSAGLEYFYPRLLPGGIILVHDYNPDWPGIMKAVDDFTLKIPESKVVLPDQDSTVMIIKSKS